MDSCGTPEVIPFQEERWPFNTTLCFRYFKKSCKRFTGFQIYHYGPILGLVLHAKRYQRLSTSLKQSLKTLLLPRDHYQKIDIFGG